MRATIARSADSSLRHAECTKSVASFLAADQADVPYKHCNTRRLRSLDQSRALEQRSFGLSSILQGENFLAPVPLERMRRSEFKSRAQFIHDSTIN